ncbi:MAG: transposase, partial [Spirochaetaceae bacterium]|nr:transposase [Spirochaetaceae bacterium]
LDKHFEGIIANATYDISAGKIEGINNKIKTIKRQGYVRNPSAHKILKNPQTL